MSKYYWIGPGQFGGGDKGVKQGEKIEKLTSEQEEVFLANGWISDKPQISERQLSELEQLREQVKNQGSGITQADLDAAKAESVQADLDRIAELEDQVSVDAQDLQEKLGLVAEAVENIQQGDKKEEIWEAVKGIKDLLKEGE